MEQLWLYFKANRWSLTWWNYNCPVCKNVIGMNRTQCNLYQIWINGYTYYYYKYYGIEIESHENETICNYNYGISIRFSSVNSRAITTTKIEQTKEQSEKWK